MSGHYCKRIRTGDYSPSCMDSQCEECAKSDATMSLINASADRKEHLRALAEDIAFIAQYIEKHSRKPVGCNATGQTEPKGLDCAASQISVSGKTTGEECPEQSGKCVVPMTKTAPISASSPTSLRIKNEKHGTWLLFEERNDDKTLVTMGHEIDGEHGMGIAMWLSDDELNRIVEWILPKSQRWP